MLAGDIAARRKNYPAAIAALEEALRIEDSLGYNEPEDWQYPVRLLLGAVLLEAGPAGGCRGCISRRSGETSGERLGAVRPRAGAAAQKKTAAAAEAHERFEAAWKYADIKLTIVRAALS